MQFKFKTEEELKNEYSQHLWEQGVYNFEVVNAEDSVSKSGNEMIKLKLRVFDNKNSLNTIIVFDYLLEAMSYKLKHFCDALFLSSEYEAGNLTADECIGKTGSLELFIQKDKTGQYEDKNAVKDYIAAPQKSNAHSVGQDLPLDDLPF